MNISNSDLVQFDDLDNDYFQNDQLEQEFPNSNGQDFIEEHILQKENIDQQKSNESEDRQSRLVRIESEMSEDRINIDSQQKQQIVEQQQQQQQQQKQQMEDINATTERIVVTQQLIKYIPEQITDIHQFLLQPIPENYIIQLTIIKDKSGMNHFYPKFELFFSSGLKMICAAKKQAFNQQINYLFSTDNKIYDRKSPTCLGKLRANSIATLFRFYDQGDNPTKSVFLDNIRKEYALISYSLSKQHNGLKRSSIIIPKIINNKPLEFRPLNYTDGLFKAYQSLEYKDKVIHHINQLPKFNQQKRTYQLKFTERVNLGSSKNFILVPMMEQNQQQFSMQFGKCGKRQFHLDICHPFSILQGFAICISQFEAKFK